jgi:hypothetical protein
MASFINAMLARPSSSSSSSFLWAKKRLKVPSLDAAAITLVTSCTLFYALDAYFETDLADADSTAECRYPLTSKLIQESHVREIEHQGFTVIPNVLSREQLKEAQQNIGSMMMLSSRQQQNSKNDNNNNKNNKYWSTSVHGNDNDVRSDSICWIRESDGTSIGDEQREKHGDGLLHAIKLIRGAGYSVESHLYSKSHSHKVPQQCQLSHYSGNSEAIYRRHLDKCDHSMAEMGLFEYLRASDYRGRALTVILYLNDADWKSGGSLRCFHTRRRNNNIEASGDNEDVDRTAAFTDVVPKGGTMIIFDSSRLEHAVLPSTKDRFALTCWLNGTTTIKNNS